MLKINSSSAANILWTMLLGMASFFVGGVIACMVLLRIDNYILATLVAGGLGGLLLGIFLHKRLRISMMAIAGVVAVPTGILSSFILVEALAGGFGLLFPSISAYFENSNIPDIFAIILMGAIFGAIFGAIIFGSKSILLFSVVCGIVSFPFGLLVGALNSGYWIKAWLENLLVIFGKIDLNLLAIVLALGIGVGLSVGLHNIKEQKNT